MRIAFVYLGGRRDRAEKQEDHPSEFFFGAHELRARGHDVKMLEVENLPRQKLRMMLLASIYSYGMLPAKSNIHMYGNIEALLPSLADREVVVATTSGLAFCLAFWRWRLRLPFEVIGIQCGIAQYHIGWLSRTSSRFLFRRMHTQLFAAPELDWMRSFFGIPDDRIEVNLFGVDTAFWSMSISGTTPPGGTSTPYVLAVGNDSRRDFETLIEAARGAAWRLVLVTRRPLPADLPKNVEIIRGSYAEGVSDAELRDLYRSAACLVVPLTPGGLQPSGQSVALQAMSCGTPVIISRTPGLFDATELQHERQLLLVEPGSPGALRDAIERILTNPPLRRALSESGSAYVLRRGRIEDYASRLEQLCRRIGR